MECATHTSPSVKCHITCIWIDKDSWLWCLSLSLKTPSPNLITLSAIAIATSTPFHDSAWTARWPGHIRQLWLPDTWKISEFDSQLGVMLGQTVFHLSVATQIHKETPIRILCVACSIDYFLGLSLVYKTFPSLWPRFTHSKVHLLGIIKTWNKCSEGEICVWKASLISKNILNFIDLGLYIYFTTS